MDTGTFNEIARLTVKVILFIAKYLMYYAATIPIFAVMGTIQERKIWKKTAQPLNSWGTLKVFLLNLCWMLFTGLGALSLVPIWIARGFGTSVSLEQNAVMEKLVGTGLHKIFVGNVKIINADKNVPHIDLYNPTKPAPVFVANHCSQIDLCIVYFIVKRFKWIAKQSVKYLPFVGFGMTLGGHIFIQRKGKNGKSVSNLYEQSNEAIQSGVPMVIFPQGTRRISEKLPFKDGAFNIAIDNETQIVPISIDVPVNIWNTSYPLNLFFSKDSDNEENVVSSIHIYIYSYTKHIHYCFFDD